jgi:hypothetical protein
MTNAREQLIDFVIARGWELDPTKTIRENWGGSHERIQDPHRFRRPDSVGGFWELELDFTRAADFRKTTNRLRRAYLQRSSVGGLLVQVGSRSYDTRITLENVDRRYGEGIDNAVWNATEGEESPTSLRQRVQTVASDPALVVWLAEEYRYTRAQEAAARHRELDRLAKARKQPLAVTVPQDDFRRLVLALDQAVGVLRRADGTTDLPKAVVDAQLALAAVNAVVPAPTEAVN